MIKCITIFLACLSVCSASRKMHAALNPGCDDSCRASLSGPLVHVTAEGENDTLHHVWDLTYQKPCLFLAVTPINTSLVIDWSKFSWDSAEGSVHFTNEPIYAFSVIFEELIEFNDANNTGKFDSLNTNTDYQIVHPMNFNWSLENSVNNNNGVVFTFVGTNQMDSNSLIKISLAAYGDRGHDHNKPHLLHTGNATQIDFELINLKTHFKSPRFVFKVVVLTSRKDETLDQIVKTSLHDEHSPGIFSVTEVLTKTDEDNKGQGYLQWRDVAYTSPDRNQINVTNIGETKALKELHPNNTFFGTFCQAYFGNELYSLPAHYFYVYFGSPNDGFYTKTNYLSWTLMVGVGKPGEESFSMLVLILLTVCLIVIPVTLIVLGIIYLISRRVSKARDDILTQ